MLEEASMLGTKPAGTLIDLNVTLVSRQGSYNVTPGNTKELNYLIVNRANVKFVEPML